MRAAPDETAASVDSPKTRRDVLLVHFGTPKNPTYADIWAFLSQVFDEHLPSVPKLIREGWIIPKRLLDTVGKYRTIWTPQGSPLLVQSQLLARSLSALSESSVALGMQCGAPSIETALEDLRPHEPEELVVLPLVPARGIAERVVRAVKAWPKTPRVRILPELFREPWYADLLAKRLSSACPENYERIIFSFHGLPVQSAPLYRDQCCRIAACAASIANLQEGKICVAFQSRVGRDTWTEPSTRDVLAALRAQGVQRALVICPSFVVDCLENLYEVGVEYRSEFLRRGGTELALVPAFNQYQPWIHALSTLL